jgi:hypothetical protein
MLSEVSYFKSQEFVARDFILSTAMMLISRAA